MDHYIHRTLTYTITNEQMDKMDERDEYLDLITIAGLFNAISFARQNGAHYQLASFSIDEKHINELHETIYLTGGLLFDALIEIERLVMEYKGQPFVMEFADILESTRDYKPPEVLLEMRHCGPFRLVAEERDFSFHTHKIHMFPMFTVMDKGFAVATVAHASEFAESLKRGEQPETHESLESLVEFLVDEFMLGADEFIFAISKKLGLKPVDQSQPTDLGLAQ